ncbi:chemotaxis protein CheA [Kaarinaea lacus]
MPIDMSQFLETFYEESFEGLDTMETELLNLEVGSTDKETINTIFRAAHSIKGGSGTFGLNAVADFTHVMETLLDEMRDGKRDVTQDGKNVLLNSVDVLREMLSALRNNDELDAGRIGEAQKSLDDLLGGVDSTDNSERQTSASLPAESDHGWKIKFRPHSDMLQTGNDPVRMFRELAALGELQVVVDTSQLPELSILVAEDSYLSWELTLHGNIDRTAIDEVFEWVEGDCDLEITSLSDVDAISTETPIKAEKPADSVVQAAAEIKPVEQKSAAAEKRRQSTSAETSSIRVSIEKIDDLINMMGELVITQSMLSQLGEADEFSTSQIEKLRDGLSQLERNTREMQENVMRIRMLPISFAFQRFPRLVHDLSSKMNKKIELIMSGEQTELDKTVMEKIGDPLVHLVRNSIDHGIELPVSGLPAAFRVSGNSIPWSIEFLTRCTRGSPIFSITVLSSSVCSPDMINSIFLFILLLRS